MKESGRVAEFPGLQRFVLAGVQYLLQAASADTCRDTAEGINMAPNL